MERWDLTMAFCLFYTSFVTPFEIGFVYAPVVPETRNQSATLLVNQLINVTFFFDIFVNFLLPYPIPSGWEKSHRKIALHYVTSMWFILDIISVIPFDIMAIIGLFGDTNTWNNATGVEHQHHVSSALHTKQTVH